MVYAAFVLFEGVEPKPCNDDPFADTAEPVSLTRKNSLTFSLTKWSSRTLVESIELGLDQLPMNWAQPSPRSCALGTGNALSTGCSAGSAGFSPVAAQALAWPRKQRSGTGLIEAACGCISRKLSWETKKKVLSFPLYMRGIRTDPPSVPPKSFCRSAGFVKVGCTERR